MQRDLLETKELVNKLLLEKEQNKNTLLQDRINTNDKSMQEITSLLKIQTNKSNVRGVEGDRGIDFYCCPIYLIHIIF